MESNKDKKRNKIFKQAFKKMWLKSMKYAIVSYIFVIVFASIFLYLIDRNINVFMWLEFTQTLLEIAVIAAISVLVIVSACSALYATRIALDELPFPKNDQV